MAFYLNLSRTLRSKKLLQNRIEKWQMKGYITPIRFHRSVVNKVNFEGSKRAIQAILILSYKPEHQIRIIQDNKSSMKDVESYSLFGAILIVTRICKIGCIIVGLTVAYLITRLTHKHAFPTILRKSIEFLGPIFIKFGQWASTRKDLFPENICHTLSQLQRTAPPHSWIYTKELLKSVYGSNWKKVFVKFENEEPIGSGCCGQVYKAWVDMNARLEVTQKPQIPAFVQIVEYLKLGSLVNYIGRTPNENDEIDDKVYGRNLQPVAVKILHPGIKAQLRRDLFIMKGICKFVTYMVPQLQWLSLTDCIDEFSHIMENQVDMNLEAANLLKFSNNFSKKKDVVFPRPYMDFTQHEILVESFYDGSPITDYLKHEDSKFQEKLAKIGIKTILKMVFNDNFIHCDLHPGNILVQTNCESTGKISTWFRKLINRKHLFNSPRLVILDCGLVVSLNDRCRQNLKDVFRSVLMGDGELAAEYMLEHSLHVSPDPDGFKRTIRDIVNSYRQSKNIVIFRTLEVVRKISLLFNDCFCKPLQM